MPPTRATLAAAAAGIALSALAFAPKPPTAAPPAAEPAAELPPRTGLPEGTPAPDALLRNADDEPVQLAQLLAEAPGPVVLIFYRGGWCPYCTKHLAQLQDHLEELDALNATLIAISPESPEKLAVTRDKSDSQFTLLSDATLQAATAYNLVFDIDPKTRAKYEGYGIDLATWNTSQEWKLPVPAVFVIDAQSVIRWRHTDEDYTKRLKADDLVQAVRTVAGG